MRLQRVVVARDAILDGVGDEDDIDVGFALVLKRHTHGTPKPSRLALVGGVGGPGTDLVNGPGWIVVEGLLGRDAGSSRRSPRDRDGVALLAARDLIGSGRLADRQLLQGGVVGAVLIGLIGDRGRQGQFTALHGDREDDTSGNGMGGKRGKR